METTGMKMKTIALMLVSTLTLTACNPFGEKVEVPPASVGMVLGKNGYQGDLVPPSRFRLSPCLFNCDKLVTIVAGDAGMVESMEVLMPADNLILGVDVQFTLALSENKAQILSVFDRVVPVQLPDGGYGTTLDAVYNTYGAAVVRNVVRSTLSQYTISEVASNQAAMSEQLRQDISEALARTPLEVKQFGLSSIRWPRSIQESMEATQERLVAIERAEADAQVQIREAQARLEVTRAEREADLLAAQTIAEANRILADGVTPEVIRYLELEVLKKMAENQNAIFFPVEMLGSIGLENRLMSTGAN
jgi:regulator of protease activity HflC (stomatin/prohibitin superfamily)